MAKNGSGVPRWVENLPRWQHVVYMLLSIAAVAAAVVNVLQASTTTPRLIHSGIAVLLSGVAISFVAWYVRRRPA